MSNQVFKNWMGAILAVMLIAMSFPALAQSSIVDEKRNELNNLQKQIEAKEKLLADKRKEVATYKTQLEILDEQIAKSELELQALEVESEALNGQLSATNKLLVDTEISIFDEKLILRETLQTLYEEQRIGVLAMLVSSDSLSQFLSRLEYLRTIQEKISDAVTQLRVLKKKLADKKAQAEKDQQRLAEITVQRQLQQRSLEAQEQAKGGLLQGALASEASYQQELEKARQQAQAVTAEIARLSSGQKATSNQPLVWPIPQRRISAGFRDAGYSKLFGLAHNAIDIPAPKGTTIKAPADGTVKRVVAPAPGNLSIIAIVHDNGLTTVYLHMSATFVSVGTRVIQGQPIGAVGAVPGEPGAGSLTTGPHLHFEVWKNGGAINPLSVLP